MPTYRNDSNHTIVIPDENVLLSPGETIVTELILDPITGLTRIADTPIWSPTTWYTHSFAAASETFQITVPDPTKDLYFAVVQNYAGIEVYFNNLTNKVLELPSNVIASIWLRKRVSDIYIVSLGSGDIICAISTEELFVR